MNSLEEKLNKLKKLLTEQQHLKNPLEVWDLFLILLRYWGVCDNSQQRFLDKAKMIMLNNKKWI
jgi:hypothetical protein